MNDRAGSDDDRAAKIRRIRKAPPPFRRVAVRSIEPLSPRLLRVVLAGEELEGFTIEAPASSVRVLVPSSPDDELVLPEWTGNQFEMPDGARAPIRTFTPRYAEAERGELTIDIVLHDHGQVTDWARRASVGDDVAVSGPGRSDHLDPDHRSHLLVGDESAIPAIGQLLEWIPLDQSITVHIEVPEPEARIELPEHDGATITWHVSGTPAPPGSEDGPTPGDALVAVVEAIDELADHVWVAGEAASVQRLRKHLFDVRGRNRSGVTARGYWKYGRAET